MLLSILKASSLICCRTDTAATIWISPVGLRVRPAVKYWLRFKATGATDVAMFRILNVAEKNDAAKSLSDIMSAGRYTKVIVFVNNFNLIILGKLLVKCGMRRGR